MRSPESFFPAGRFGAVKSVTPVSMGLSGAGVFAVTTGAGEFFLRLQAAGEQGLEPLLTAQRLAAAHGIAPGIVLADEDAGAVVMEKAQGMPIGAALGQPAIRPQVLRGVAAALARLHAIAAPDLPPSDPALAAAIWNQQSGRDGFPAWARPLGEFIAAGDAALAQDRRRVFSHNDVNPANLLWDGTQVWMVDWERAALSHPYMDLAIFSIFAILSDDDALALLALQEDAVLAPGRQQMFLLLRNYARAIYGAVFLRLIPDLTAITFRDRDETPDLAECYGLMGRGALDPRMPAGQALLGAAMLRQAPLTA